MRSENSTIFSGLNASLLWENPNPTNELNQGLYQFNDNFTPYDYLLIEFKPQRLEENPIKKMLIKIDEFELYQNKLSGALGLVTSDNRRLTRGFYLEYSKPNSIYFFGSVYENGTSSGSIVPLKIYGVKGSIQGIK